jgi:hypothetical protein
MVRPGGGRRVHVQRIPVVVQGRLLARKLQVFLDGCLNQTEAVALHDCLFCRTYDMHMVATVVHQSLQIHLHVGHIVLGLLVEFNFSLDRDWLAVGEPLLRHSFAPVDSPDSRTDQSERNNHKMPDLHGTRQTLSSSFGAKVVVQHQRLAQDAVVASQG